MHLITSTLITLISILLSLNAYAQVHIDPQLCDQTNPYLAHRVDVLKVTGETEGVWLNDNIEYVAVGENGLLKAKQGKRTIVSTSFPFIQIVTTRDFYYFSAYPTFSLENGPTPQESFAYRFEARGPNKIIAVALDDLNKDFTLNGISAFVPICDVITVYAHERPLVNLHEMSVGQSIYISLDVTLDNYSKSVREFSNYVPKVKWSFFNENTGSKETLVTDGAIMNFAPKYNGFYRVEIEVSDGGLTQDLIVHAGHYSGGIDPTGPIFELR